MRRRGFITLLGGAVTWPIMARGRRRGGTLPRVVNSTASACAIYVVKLRSE
jgi:hypothetical protein